MRMKSRTAFPGLLFALLASTLFFAPQRAAATADAVAAPFIGPIPVQYATAGETFTLDLHRFFELSENWTITAPAATSAFATRLDENAMRLDVRVNVDHPGLVDIPLTVRGRLCHGAPCVLTNYLTVAAGRKQRVEFSFTPSSAPSEAPRRAVVAGGFNGWSQDRTVLEDRDGDGTYTATMLMDPGTYSYKFVVDGRWIADPGNPNQAPDGFGGFNSMLSVAGAAGGRAPFLYPDTMAGGRAEIVIVNGDDSVTEICAIAQYEDGVSEPLSSGRLGERIVIPIEHLPIGAWVRVVAADAAHRFSNVVRFQPRPDSSFHWQDAVLYFPMTDRFLDGDTSNDHPVIDTELLPQANFSGGDWSGIRAKIRDGYFQSLGVNVLWLSPLNKNPDIAYREYQPPYRFYSGYHGYWPVSPTEPESRFGTMDDLKGLAADAHDSGLKLIADMVLNHVHELHPFYRRHPDWFSSLTLPDGTRNLRRWDEYPYTTWFEPFLPDLDLDNPDASEAMIDNAAWWTREIDLDGYRLDAVKHIPPSFWRRFRVGLRERIERERGERLFMVGETFMDRTGIMSFVGPNMLDGQFDFPLYDIVLASFSRENAGLDELDAAVTASERQYGKETIMSTLLGNQDKSRFMAYADGDLPDTAQPDEEEVGWTTPPRVDNPERYARLKMAQTFLMTIDGAPMLYYGDEFGMTGAADPDNRRMMRFGDALSPAERDVLDHCRLVTAIRKAHPALRYGSRRAILAERDRYAFVRAFWDDRVVVAFNRSDTSMDLELSVGPEFVDGMYRDELTGRAIEVKNGVLKLTLFAHTSAVISRAGASLPPD